MKLIIAGSRSFTDTNRLIDFVNGLIKTGAIEEEGLEIVSGMAKGADACGIEIAKANNLPLRKFPADWILFGKSAGYRRNTQMGQYANVLVAAWNGTSMGTAHMIDYMEKLGKPVYILEF